MGVTPVVVDRVRAGGLAQVGRNAGGHRGWVERAALPLQERPRCVPAPQQPKGVGVDRAQRPLVPEVPGRAVRRVEQRDMPATIHSRLRGEPRQEPVRAGGTREAAG